MNGYRSRGALDDILLDQVVNFTGWGDAYLLGSSGVSIETVVWPYMANYIKDSNIACNLVDWLGWLCLEEKKSENEAPPDSVWVHEMLVDWYPEKANKRDDAIQTAFDAFLWTRVLVQKNAFTSEEISDIINGPSLPRDNPWSVHRRLEAAMKRRSVGDVVTILKTQRLPDPDRLKVYSFLLCVDTAHIPIETVTDQSIGRRNFAKRFEKLVGLQRCGCGEISEKFLNRIVLVEWGKLLRDMIRVLDPPVAEWLDTIKSSHGESPFDSSIGSLVESVFAASAVSDNDLLYLWDKLLLSPPDVLVKVLAFSIVEVRDFILASKDVEDVLLGIGELVDDFPSLVDMAIDSHELVFD
jgi:hypothetical protein